MATTRTHDHRILVCLDGSPFSEACLPYAISLARTFGSAVTLTHVMQPRHDHPGPHTTDALAWEIARQEARGYLERQQQVVADALGKPVDLRLEQGHPAERIVEVARELGVDLTVLGSHGEGGVTAWNLGSTVQQVLAMTRGSVFIAHASSLPSTFVHPQRILVPLDGSLRTESVLPTAARLATAYGAELVLVHVVPEPVASLVVPAGADLELAGEVASRHEHSAERYLASVQARLDHDGPRVRCRVIRHANERQGLLEISREEHADLVVVSAHGLACDPARAFGSVTEHLLSHSRVPVLVLQDLPLDRGRTRGQLDQYAPPLRASYPPEAM